MSEVKVNKISPRSGTTVTLGDSGDTITIPSGVTLANSGTFTNFQSTGIDDNATSTAITIDSSGNLLVGKTNNALSNDGIVIREGGEILATNTSDLTANFNRLSTDGDIVSFYKDGTTIGKIGVFASDNIYLSGNSSHAGIQFGSESVLGFKNSSIANNTLDLGNGTAQWRDLYLGGGLYVGGTGSANYLDDYEEGTWTPVYNATGITYSSQHGKYTKIGDIVIVSVSMATSDTTSISGSGTLNITGLPFTSEATNPRAVMAVLSGRFSSNQPNYGLITQSSSQIDLRNTFDTSTQISDIAVNASTNQNVTEAVLIYHVT